MPRLDRITYLTGTVDTTETGGSREVADHAVAFGDPENFPARASTPLPEHEINTYGGEEARRVQRAAAPGGDAAQEALLQAPAPPGEEGPALLGATSTTYSADDVPDGSADDVTGWVDEAEDDADRQARAQAALDAEPSVDDGGRKGLTASLEAVLAESDGDDDDGGEGGEE